MGGNTNDIYTIIQILQFTSLTTKATLSKPTDMVKARENKHAASFTGLELLSNKKKKKTRKKKELDYKYLIFTAVNHCVTDRFPSLFFLFLVRS